MMWRKTLLILALAVGLLTVAGAAVAAIGSDRDTFSSDDVALTATPSMDDATDGATSTTAASTSVASGDDDESESISGSTTTTTTTGASGEDDRSYSDDDSDSHDDYDDDYDDDDYDDDDGYVMVADGVYPIDVSPYGSVTVEVMDGVLYLTSIDVDPVWVLHKRDEKSDEVELGFYWGESELKIEVEIDDGQLKKMVEFDMK